MSQIGDPKFWKGKFVDLLDKGLGRTRRPYHEKDLFEGLELPGQPRILPKGPLPQPDPVEPERQIAKPDPKKREAE